MSLFALFFHLAWLVQCTVFWVMDLFLMGWHESVLHEHDDVDGTCLPTWGDRGMASMLMERAAFFSFDGKTHKRAKFLFRCVKMYRLGVCAVCMRALAGQIEHCSALGLTPRHIAKAMPFSLERKAFA